MADVPDSPEGGMSGALSRSSAALGDLGHEVVPVLRDDLAGAWCGPRLRRLVVPLAVVARIRRLHRGRALDLAEVHEPIAGPYGLVASTRWGQRNLPPCAVMSHGLEERCWREVVRRRRAGGRPVPAWSRAVTWATRVLPARLGLRLAAQAIVLNRADAEWLLAAGLPEDRISVVANGVEDSLLEVERRPAGHLRALFLGSWLERKGVADLAEAWADVHRHLPGARLTVAGVGPAPVLDGFPAPCRGSVTVVPRVPREGLSGLLGDHDVLALPSWYEGMPLVALEAAAAGLAVVASAVPGVVDVFRPPDPELDGALLVEAGRPGDLAAALLRLGADDRLLARLQAGGRRRALDFPWASAGSALERAYRRAVDGAGTYRSAGGAGGARRAGRAPLSTDR